MKTDKISGIIFLVFLIIGLLPSGQQQQLFISPFFLNELALVIWSLSAAILLKKWSPLLIGAVFLIGTFQNAYFLEFLQFSILENTWLLIWGIFSFSLMALLLMALVQQFRNLKTLTTPLQWTWFIYFLLLISLFVVATTEDTVMILSIFSAQLIFLLALLFKTPFQSHHLIWEAWLLYSALEVMKVLTLLG